MDSALRAVHNRLDKFSIFIEELKFRDLFLYWVGVAVVFGLLYYILLFFPGNGLLQGTEPLPPTLKSLGTAEYFSFITSETVGYGDIAPKGFSRVLAALEGFLGFLMFGIVIAKLVSSKQERVLDEVYQLSFEEKLNRIRAALFLFRGDVSKFIDRTAETYTKRDAKDLWMVLSSLESTLADAVKMTCRTATDDHKRYLRTVDEFHVTLITSSMIASLTRLVELTIHLDAQHASWRHPQILERISSIILVAKHFANVHTGKNPQEKLQTRLTGLAKLCDAMNRAVAKASKETHAELMRVVESDT